jgi:hypothetical protein
LGPHILPHIQPPEIAEVFHEVKADLSRADVETLARARVKRIQHVFLFVHGSVRQG